MKRIVTLAALLLAVTPALAEEGSTTTTKFNDPSERGLYLNLVGGISFPYNSDDADFDTGGMGGLAVGYDFGPMFRTEIEGSYRFYDLDDIDVVDGEINADGDASIMAAMLNLYADFSVKGSWSPYVGGGIGVASVDIDGNGDFSFDDNDTALAWQGIAGIAYTFREGVSLATEYRYFATASDAEDGDHNILLSLRFDFF